MEKGTWDEMNDRRGGVRGSEAGSFGNGGVYAVGGNRGRLGGV